MMSEPVKRRDFLTRSIAISALPLLAAPAPAQDPKRRRPKPPAKPPGISPGSTVEEQDDSVPARAAKPLYLISLAEWSLHRALHAEELTNLDFPAYAKKTFDINSVEYVNSFFKDKAKDAAYLTDLKKRCDDAQVKSLLIMVDGEGALGAPEKDTRRTAVENHFKWVEAAKFLGCHSIRVNAQSAGTFADQQQRAADGLRQLCEFADDHEIDIIVENHGGLSSHGRWLAQTIELVDHPRCGTLPDFGNFRIGGDNVYNRYRGVAELMPHANAVSAKSYDFDEEGNETTIDYLRMMKIVINAEYHGHVGIEYEGRRLSEPEGILATRRLLERAREGLSI